MRRLLLLSVAVALAGCQRYRYEINLTPAGPEMLRSMTVTKANSSGKMDGVPLEELKRLALIYKAEIKDKTANTAAFAGRFQQAMPQDIGGSGTHATFATSLGTFHIYVEQFRGQDDLLAQWERQTAAVDLFVDLSIGWTQETLKGEAGLDKLHTFLDRDFRRDMKNALLYVHWSGVSLHDQGTDNQDEASSRTTELIAMVAQYFQSRGYFEVDDLPRLYTAGINDESREWALMLSRRQILKRMGRDTAESVPKPLAALNTPDAWRASVEKYAQNHPDALARTERWAAARKRQGAQNNQDPLTQAFNDLVDLNLFGYADQLELRLHPGNKPFAGNGRWNAAAGVMTWSRSLNTSIADSTGLPVTAVALWCEPDASEQGRILGFLRLRDRVLASYCLERFALSEAQGDQWDRFLKSLAPEEKSADKLRVFRFKGEENDKGMPAIAELIAAGLDADK